MIYCQLLGNSTGYVNGTIPPVFSKKHVKPIDLCGSDSRIILDGRKSINNLIYDCKSLISKRKDAIIGFKIIRANDYREQGNIIRTVYL